MKLAVSKSFRLDITVWTLRRMATNKVDRWDGSSYRRVFALDDSHAGGATAGHVVEIAVTQPERGSLEVHFEPRDVDIDLPMRAHLLETIESMLGIRVSMAGFNALARNDSLLAPMARQFMGLSPPRYPSIFEAIVNAISCQQLSLAVGIELMNRLAMLVGVAGPGGARAFPRPADIARRRVNTVRDLGYGTAKASWIIALAREIESGQIDLDAISQLDDDAAIAALEEIPGMGHWSAQYVLLRGMGRLNVFPEGDSGFHKKLGIWLGKDAPGPRDEVRKLMNRWHPYEGILYFFMLLTGLAQRGLIDGKEARRAGQIRTLPSMSGIPARHTS